MQPFWELFSLKIIIVLKTYGPQGKMDSEDKILTRKY